MPRELRVPLLFVPPAGWEVLDVDARGVPEAAFGARSPASDGDFHPNVLVLDVPHAPDETLTDIVTRRASSLVGLPAEVDAPGRTGTSGAVATCRQRVDVTMEVHGSLRELVEDQVFTDVTDPRTGRRGVAVLVLTTTAATRDGALGAFDGLLRTVRPDTATTLPSGLSSVCRSIEYRVARDLTVPLVVSAPAGWVVVEPEDLGVSAAFIVRSPEAERGFHANVVLAEVPHESGETLVHAARRVVDAFRRVGNVRVLDVDGSPARDDAAQLRQRLLVDTEVDGERRELLHDQVLLDVRDPTSGTRAIVRVDLALDPHRPRETLLAFRRVVASVRVDEARHLDPPRVAAAPYREARRGSGTGDLRVPLRFGALRGWDVVDPGRATVAAVFMARSPESDEGFHPVVVVHDVPHAPDETLADIARRMADHGTEVGDVEVVERGAGPPGPAPTFRQVLVGTAPVAGELRDHVQDQVFMDFEHPGTRRRSVTAFVLTTPPTLRRSCAQVFAEFLRTVRVDERRVGP